MLEDLVLALVFVKLGDVHSKGIPAFECFVAEVTRVDKNSREMDSLKVVLHFGWNLRFEAT